VLQNFAIASNSFKSIGKIGIISGIDILAIISPPPFYVLVRGKKKKGKKGRNKEGRGK